MTRVYLGLGTNLGDKRKNLDDALLVIKERIGTVVSLSSFYETAPWGFESQNSFLNAAVGVDTALTPEALMQATQKIEKQLGRRHKSVQKVYHDRPIDIDILLYGDAVLQTETLTIPHPEMTERRFVMEPLAEIAPDVVHPVFGKTISKLLSLIP
jgi:2-amino-4-hydroxy-6-hydroxymethyldihydropteridine diphosphokinase